MSLLAESMEQLLMKAFLQQCNIEMFGSMSEKITLLQSLMSNPNENQEHIGELWKVCLVELESFEHAFNEFKMAGYEKINSSMI